MSARARVCKECGIPTLAAGPYCPTHARGRFGPFQSGARSLPVYKTSAWRSLSAKVRAEHVEAAGWTCPGWHRDPHPTRDLTVDHVVAIQDGGAVLERSNLRVLCRSCNSRRALGGVQARRRARGGGVASNGPR